MKRILLFCLVCVLQTVPVAWGQEITEANYIRLDTELWEDFEQKSGAIWNQVKAQTNPAIKDSLERIYDRLGGEVDRKNEQLAIRFASTPSGLHRVFMVRLDLPKDTLKAVLARLPKAMRQSPYGKSIAAHIHSHQLQVGDRAHDFTLTDAEGKKITRSSLRGKQILVLYDGLGCMGPNGRDYLESLYKRTSRDKFVVLAYCSVDGVADLKKIQADYGLDFVFASDFLDDHSPLKIGYGAQSRPTCFLIEPNGKVSYRSVGVYPDALDKLIP